MSRCPTCGRKELVWNRETVINAFQRWADEHGNGPSAADWQLAGRGHPSIKTVNRLFGSFVAARDASGVSYQPGNVKHSATRDWTREKVCTAVYLWYFAHGRIPRRNEWAQPPEGYPTANTVLRLFGSWNAAMADAGYTPRRFQKFEKKDSTGGGRLVVGDGAATARRDQG